MDFDISGSPGRFFASLVRELKSIAISNIAYFKDGTLSHHAKFHVAFCLLFEYLDRGIEPCIRELSLRVHEFDASPNEKGNGYRSLLRVVQKCCMHLLQISRHISTNKESMLFRRAFYMKELEAYVATIGQLRAFLYYALKMMACCQPGVLIPDEKTLDDALTEQLMNDLEMLSLECFYGRCLGFQFCESMQRPLQLVAIAMASFGEGYQENSQLMKVATSLFNSGKYFMNPDLRAQQISSVTRTAGIQFCKQFWSITESEIMHQLPSMVGPAVQVDEVFHLGPDAFSMPSADGQEEVTITPPCAHTGPAPVQVRLISYLLREGQDQHLKSSKSPSTRNPLVKKERSCGLLVHVHGGGFVAQSSRSHEVYLRHWAKDLNVPILSIDYSLAPESPFPRALEECFYAYTWAIHNCETLGSTGEVIVLAGDSAGGNLILTTAMRAASFNVRRPDSMLCVYPCVLVQYTPSPARLLCLMDPLLPAGILARCLAAYAGVEDDLSSQLASSVSCHIESSAATLRMSSNDSKEDAEWVVVSQDSAARTDTALASQHCLHRIARSDSADSEVEIFSRPKTAGGSFSSIMSDATDKLVSYVGTYLPAKAFSFSGNSSQPEQVPLSPVQERAANDTASVSTAGAGSRVDESPATPSFHTPMTTPSDDRGASLYGSLPRSEMRELPEEKGGRIEICLEDDSSRPAFDDTGRTSLTVVSGGAGQVDVTQPISSGHARLYKAADEGPGPIDAGNEIQTISIDDRSSPVDTKPATQSSTQTPASELDMELITSHTGLSFEDSNINSGPCQTRKCESQKEPGSSHVQDASPTATASFHSFKTSPAFLDEMKSSEWQVDCDGAEVVLTSGSHTVAKAGSETAVTASHSASNVMTVSSSVDAPEGLPLFQVLLPSPDSGCHSDIDKLDTQGTAGLSHPAVPGHGSPQVHKAASREGMQLHLHRSTSMSRSYSQPVLNKPELVWSVNSMSPADFRRERHLPPSPVRAIRNNPIAKNPYMSPLLAPDALLDGLPDICLVACQLDPLLDDSIMFTRRLRSLGKSVDLVLLDDLPHGFLNFAMVSRDAKLASDLCVRKLKSLLKLDSGQSTGI